ncbi:MAG TPA: hypothetical protein VFM75_04700 [Modicisalibacter sp.]|nr:hypothetical protein [Modicisalibacter sp.]
MTIADLRTRGCALVVALFLALAFDDLAEAQPAATGPPDWPCVQRLIPELAWGTLWAGPSPEELEQAWWDDEEIGSVVRFATSRDTSVEDAVARVRAFVENESPDEQRLTLLFSGLFEQINDERSSTIASIRSASRAQVARLERISEIVDELEIQRASDADEAAVTPLEKELHWELRTFEMRQQGLPALCEQPYLLEERLARMIRVIDAKL